MQIGAGISFINPMNVSKYSKCLLIFLVFYFASVSCQVVIEESDIQTDENEIRMTQWLNYLCSSDCSGRFPGTEGSLKASEYIISQLTLMGYEPLIQEFKVADVIMRNVVVTIPGTKDSCIVIGAHYDGQYASTEKDHYPAANDNASGVVTLLRVANDLSAKRVSCPYSIQLCFWDGEESTLGKPFKGSGYYVSCSQELKRIKYYHNLDSVGHDHKRSYKIFYYGEWIKKEVVPFVQDNYDLNFTEVAFKDRGAGSSDYVSFSKKGVPVINVFNDHSSGCHYHYHSVTDTPDAISIPLLSTMAAIVEDVMQLL